MGTTDRDVQARRRRGLLFGGAGLVLLFVPAVFLILSHGPIGLYPVVAMLMGIVLLFVGFINLPGSLANLLRPKP